MMKSLATLIGRITYPMIAAVGYRFRGSQRHFPWAYKQLRLGPGGGRTIVRLPGTRVFLLRNGTAGDFSLMVWIWQRRNGWVRAGVLFAQHNKEGGIHISDVRVDYQGNGYGTLLVRTVLDVAAAMGASHVEGDLSSVDDVPRLVTFYGRLGFDITLTATDDRGYVVAHIVGHIMKKLNGRH